jgi:hypothetical protein
MPYIKQISIHSSPKSFLKYILNGDKNSHMKYAEGLNIPADVDSAYSEFKVIFEGYSNDRFYKHHIDTQKSRVRLHHYIQSFDPKEKISPEQAHAIGLEWAKKVFGENRQIICSTHIDKGHIHNHFAVASYDIKGNIWYSNLKSLRAVRNASDEICLSHGLSIIENPSRRAEPNRKRVKGGFKEKVRADIDKLLTNPFVRTLPDLVDWLEREGYTVRFGHYLTITPPGRERGIRSEKLGDGYSIDELTYRIERRGKAEPIPLEKLLEKGGEGARVIGAVVHEAEANALKQSTVSYSSAQMTIQAYNYYIEHGLHNLSEWEILNEKLRQRIENAADKDERRKAEDELYQSDKLYHHCEKVKEQYKRNSFEVTLPAMQARVEARLRRSNDFIRAEQARRVKAEKQSYDYTR